MGLSWQQGPLSPHAAGHFLVPEPLPERMLFAEPLRRRMRVRFGGVWIVDSEDVVLLHEPGRYPVAYFPLADVEPGVLTLMDHRTRHRDLGVTAWFTVAGDHAGTGSVDRAAWQHVELPAHAAVLDGRVAFAWRAMDAFYEEDDRIVGHAADAYHRTDVRHTSRHLVVRTGGRVVAESTAPMVLFESGFAPRWYVPRADVDESALTPVTGQTFCPYKGLASYYDVGPASRAAWSYREAWTEADLVRDMVSFEPDKVQITLDDAVLRLEPGQQVVAHGIDRGLTAEEVHAPR